MGLTVFMTYVAVVIILIVLIGVIKAYYYLDEFEVMIGVACAVLWIVVLPILLSFGLVYFLIKLGMAIGEKIRRHPNG